VLSFNLLLLWWLVASWRRLLLLMLLLWTAVSHQRLDDHHVSLFVCLERCAVSFGFTLWFLKSAYQFFPQNIAKKMEKNAICSMPVEQ
jgi:hypothetical protein